MVPVGSDPRGELEAGEADADGSGLGEGGLGDGGELDGGTGVGLAVGAGGVGLGVSVGVGAGVGDSWDGRGVGFGVGVAVRRGVGFGVGVGGARTTIVPAMPESMWTRQMYGYVPGWLKVTSKRPPASTRPESKASPSRGSLGPLPLVTVWGSPAKVQTTVSPTEIVNVAGSKT